MFCQVQPRLENLPAIRHNQRLFPWLDASRPNRESSAATIPFPSWVRRCCGAGSGITASLRLKGPTREPGVFANFDRLVRVLRCRCTQNSADLRSPCTAPGEDRLHGDSVGASPPLHCFFARCLFRGGRFTQCRASSDVLPQSLRGFRRIDGLTLKLTSLRYWFKDLTPAKHLLPAPTRWFRSGHIIIGFGGRWGASSQPDESNAHYGLTLY